MTHISGRLNRFVLVSFALVCAGVAGCRDAETTSPRTIPTPSGPMRDLGTVIVHVNLKNRTIDIKPAASSVAKLPPGVSAKYFGNSTQIEYHLSEQDFTDLGDGDIEYNIHAGFANLLDFAIGTNSPHTYPIFPQDTMGVYVFFAFLPYNFQSTGGPCAPPACTVQVDSADGMYPFTTGEPQPYVFWKSILEAGGEGAPEPGPFETDQSGIGGINYYRRMSFRTHGNMTDFSFGLTMAAAWVDPNESRWKVTYLGDSVPTRTSLDALNSDPDWRRLGSTGAVTITPAACVPNTAACKLTLVGTAGDSLIFYRSDSVRDSQTAYIAADLSLSTLTGAEPGVFLGLKDPTKLVQMGISTASTGFTDSTGTLLPLYSFPTVLTRPSYRVVKYGTDSASIFSPIGSTVALMTIPYSALPPAPVRGSGPPNYDRFFFFGNMTASIGSTAATSLWTDVNYEIGADTP